MKKFKNIFILSVVALLGLQLAACSDDDYNTNPYSKSGVNLLAFGPSPNTRSGELRITGTNLNQVDKVVFPAGNVERAGRNVAYIGAEIERSNFLSADNENIFVTIPETAVPGTIRLVVGNDTIVSEGLITFEEPIEVASVTPTENLNAGDEITIKGEYVYNIATVTFSSGISGAPVAAEQFTYVSRNEVRLLVPLAAESGVINFSDGADWEETYKDTIAINTATVSDITPSADFGQQIQITGSNLHTVESVMFAGGVSADFTVSADHKTITATVPADAKSGPVSLVLYSGEAISTPDFAVPTVTITSASPKNDLVEGDIVTLTGENFDRVTGVTLPGHGDLQSTEYAISGNTLTFTVPEDMTDGDVVLKQNANISAAITLEMRKLFGVVWQGKENLNGWSNWGVFNWDGDKWTKFQQAFSGPGELTIHMVVTNDNPMYKIRMGDWATRISGAAPFESEDGGEWIIHPKADNADLVLNLTASEVAEMFGDGGKGIVIWGDGIQLQYIKYVVAGGEVPIWEGNEDLSDGHQPYIGSDGGAEFTANNVQAGQVVRFYVTVPGAEWWFQVFEGHWGPMYVEWNGAKAEDAAQVAAEGCLKLTLTQDMIDAALKPGGWGGIFVIQGSVTVTKVTVANQ